MKQKIPVGLILLITALSLGACGRRGSLDTPVSYDQATPGTAAANAAANPPLDAEGKPLPVPTQPKPVPYGHSFPLDPILN